MLGPEETKTTLELLKALAELLIVLTGAASTLLHTSAAALKLKRKYKVNAFIDDAGTIELTVRSHSSSAIKINSLHVVEDYSYLYLIFRNLFPIDRFYKFKILFLNKKFPTPKQVFPDEVLTINAILEKDLEHYINRFKFPSSPKKPKIYGVFGQDRILISIRHLGKRIIVSENDKIT